MLQETIAFLIGLRSEQHSRGIGLQAMLKFLQIAFAVSSERLRPKLEDSCKVHVTKEPKNQLDENGQERDLKIVNFWCFSAFFG